MRRQELPPVVQRMYDLAVWLLERVEKFPRSARYVLGRHVEETALRILRLLVQANYTRNRRGLLRRANLELDQLRFLVRMSMDRGFLAPKQYAFASEQMTDVGRQIGGWMKQQAEPTP